MRITLVADNSTSPNWGCRATSFALRELLSQRHEIVATIDRAVLSAPLTSSSKLPGELHDALVRRFRRKRVARFPVVGRAAIRLIDAAGRYHAPSHDSVRDADLLLAARHSSPKARHIVNSVEACDAIVVNGEGEMIFSTPARPTLLQTLAICALADKLGKPVYYLNGMVSTDPGTPLNQETVEATRRGLADATIAVRDAYSRDVAAALLPDIATSVVPDALFGWSRYFRDNAGSPYDAARLLAHFDRTGSTMPSVTRAPFIAISGSSMSARDPQRAADRYTALAQGLRALDMPILLVATCIGDRFLTEVARRTGLPLLPVDTPILAGAAVMANARLLVSGRWHPSIMAALGGTPCVFMGSNSHKTLSLQYMLNYPDPVEYSSFPSDADIAGIVADSRARLAEGTDRRTAIAATAAALSAETAGLLDLVR